MSPTDLDHRFKGLPSMEGRPITPGGTKMTPRAGIRRSWKPVIEMGGSAVAALAAIWLTFTIAGLSAPFGLVVSSFLLFLVIYGVVSNSLHGSLVMKDRLASVAVWSGAFVALGALAAVIGFVVFKGAPVVFARFPHFLFADMTQAGGANPVTDVGAGAAIMGTLEEVGIATILTVPLAILTATYLIESRSLLARVVRNVVDAMTGTPSIIAGIFLYLIWVFPRANGGVGKTGLTAALALSVLMLPLVTRAAFEVIRIVPGSLREAALALGSPQWRVVLKIVLPTARVGLITAAILGVARTAGETAEVLFTAGGNSHYNLSPAQGFQDSLPLRIFELINQPSVNAIREAWGVAFVLVAVVLGLFMTARFIGSAGAGGFAPRRRVKRILERRSSQEDTA